jgi:hypothetical protein
MSTEFDELDEEAKMHRGYVTLYEQTKDGENYDKGDHYVVLGYGETSYKLVDEGTPEQDFVPRAVPVVRIELPNPLNPDELGDWLTSDVGRAVMAPHIDEVDAPDLLTPHGRNRADTEPVADGSVDSNSMPEGLYDKYKVLKDGEPQESSFVLKPENDEAALEALRTYANETDDRELRSNLRGWIMAIEESVNEPKPEGSVDGGAE